MKDRIYAIMVAILLASNVAAGIILNEISKQHTEQAKEYIPTVTPTPTPDVERIELMQENERLRQEVINLRVFKSDLEGFLEAQIRR